MMALPVATRLAPAPRVARVLWSDSPQARAPARRSEGDPEEDELPVDDSWVAATNAAIFMNSVTRVFCASASLVSSVGGNSRGGSSLLLAELAETALLETKFMAVRRACPPALARPSSWVLVSDFCSDKAPTTPAVPLP